ncbi:FtsK/SpoIIIE family DNA translocase [Leptospira ilyithenensis]|uniref:DNA translocase FtsK n=1 Tax=Leptospira ilyithenensis TaxID=2484901 RepID=A0A4R9LSU6_9LEPT|nr:DNA translocase FtsK 4TM domain-containing protein [Leptospira ilyithenensis]TGN11972.1 DNA translocase FtsK [Leptospira ilyithenensis]
MDNKEKAIPKWNAIRQDFTPYILVFLGVFLLLSLFSFTETEDGTGANWFGRIGYYVSFTLFYLLGKSSFLLAGFSLILGVISFKNPEFDRLGKALFFPLFIIGSSVALNVLETPLGQLGDGGGVFGQFFSWVLNYLFGETGRIIVVFFLFLYSAVIWLEDSTWNFTLGKLQSFANVMYKGFGGTRDLSHWKLPSFLNGTIVPEAFPAKPIFGEDIHSKKWFERKLESEIDTVSGKQESMIWEDEEPAEFPFPKETKKAETQKLIYKNTSLYEGFFEESGDSFRFHKTSVSLQKKLRTESFLPDAFKIKVSDFRGLAVPEIIEEVVALPLYPFSQKSETNIVSETLESKFPELSSGSSLHKPISKFSFDDIDLYPGRQTKESVLELDTKDLEEGVEPLNEVEDDVLSLPISVQEEEEWEEEFPTVESEIDDSVDYDEVEASEDEEEDEIPSNVYALEKPKAKPKKEEKKEFAMGSMVPIIKLKKGSYYISPKLLADHKQSPSFTAKFDSELETVGRKIEEIIGYYGIESKVIARERGPIITRYELTIPHGIKLSRITSLSDELKLHLAVKNIRIVAPIPGKSSIGIEVPNIHREDVFLSEILKESILQNKTKDLTIAIGKDISGKTVIIDLAKLPHLLVAGTTGSGKSVSLNSMITSLICTRSPEEVRFIMIDPKMVEMTLYEDIPHLLMPVITDPKKATKALSWAIQEMESRYQMVSQLKSRDFKSYNDKVEEFAHKKGYQKFPYIVIFIDELADLMMVSGKDLEDQITRISQKSRAVGIHLVMATQRPSVDVITGLIKANCPARVAFHVAQKTDSRTILDTNGAESLLGKGDFLYRSPTSADLTRIQAPYIEEKEIEAIVEEAKKQGAPAYVEMNWDEEGNTESGSEEDEELFDEAWNIVVSEKKASASYLQRRMRIGYNKAARLMELMEMRGYVSPQIGSKPREILRSA